MRTVTDNLHDRLTAANLALPIIREVELAMRRLAQLAPFGWSEASDADMENHLALLVTLDRMRGDALATIGDATQRPEAYEIRDHVVRHGQMYRPEEWKARCMACGAATSGQSFSKRIAAFARNAWVDEHQATCERSPNAIVELDAAVSEPTP